MTEHNANIMKQAHELAPFLTDALDGLRDDLTIPAGDEREWDTRDNVQYHYVVDVAEAIVRDDSVCLGMMLRDRLMQEARKAKDDALDRDQEVRQVGEW